MGGQDQKKGGRGRLAGRSWEGWQRRPLPTRWRSSELLMRVLQCMVFQGECIGRERERGSNVSSPRPFARPKRGSCGPRYGRRPWCSLACVARALEDTISHERRLGRMRELQWWMHQYVSNLLLNFNFLKFIIFLYFNAHKINSINQI